MTSNFVLWQKRARQIERELAKMPDNEETRPKRRALVQERRALIERMAQAIKDKEEK